MIEAHQYREEIEKWKDMLSEGMHQMKHLLQQRLEEGADVVGLEKKDFLSPEETKPARDQEEKARTIAKDAAFDFMRDVFFSKEHVDFLAVLLTWSTSMNWSDRASMKTVQPLSAVVVACALRNEVCTPWTPLLNDALIHLSPEEFSTARFPGDIAMSKLFINEVLTKTRVKLHEDFPKIPEIIQNAIAIQKEGAENVAKQMLRVHN